MAGAQNAYANAIMLSHSHLVSLGLAGCLCARKLRGVVVEKGRRQLQCIPPPAKGGFRLTRDELNSNAGLWPFPLPNRS